MKQDILDHQQKIIDDQHSVKAPLTKIAEYSQTAAGLADLRTRYADVIFPVETSKGMNDALSARKELRELRIGLEKMRVQLKAPALERSRLIDAEAKDITGQLVALEDPIDTQIKAEEQKKEAAKQAREKAERERVAAIQAQINGIKQLLPDSIYDTAEQLGATLADLTAFEVTEAQFAEFVEDARLAKDSALQSLQAQLEKVAAQEEEAARVRLEAERLRTERAEFDRQQAIAASARAEAERIAVAAAAEAAEEIRKLRAELEASRAIKVETVTASGDHATLSAHDSATDLGEDSNALPLNAGDTLFAEVLASDAPALPVESAAEFAAGANEEVNPDSFVHDLARFTALQFAAMAQKAGLLGFGSYAHELNNVAEMLNAGEFDHAFKHADWVQLADTDKKMALASHALVAQIMGDEAMGPSVLR